ncbi:ABC transporter ATP-binding protein [Thermodesulfobacteriota bacterium]
MNDYAIKVENLSKRYRIGVAENKSDTLFGAFSSLIKAPIANYRRLKKLTSFDEPRTTNKEPGTNNEEPRTKNKEQDTDIIWALKDISFEVKHGEVIGIIGRNGAGKSTLLKIISRITDPTSGRVIFNGRVSSLLEVGTGFHPDLTGKENIYLNGTILGMSKTEIDQRFDQIVDFSEVEKFIDTPVKRYSSGMKVRLAFSVAAHLEPEILLIDEVLAVGDVAFQKKCLGKMGSVAKEGRTVIFVSHNMGAVNSLTQKCIYLQGGKIIAYNDSRSVIDQYLMDSIEHHRKSSDKLDFYRRAPLTSDSPVKITGVWVDESKKEPLAIELGNPFTIFVQLNVNRVIREENLTVRIKNIQGDQCALFFSLDHAFSLSLKPGKHIVAIKVENNPFSPGQYFATIGVNQSTQSIAYDVIVDFPIFRVVNNGQVIHWLNRPWGVVHSNSINWLIVE